MKCNNCGMELKNGSVFCPKCGKDVELVSDISLEDEYLNNFLEGKSHRSGSSKKRAVSEQSQNRKLVVVSVLVVLFVIAIMASIIVFVVRYQNSNSYDYQYTHAQAAQDSGKTDKAIGFYERALKLKPKSIEVRLALGEIYLGQKDYDSALLMFEEAVNIDDKAVDAYIGLIRVYEDKKEYESISLLADSIEDQGVKEALSGYLVGEPEFSTQGGEYDDTVEIELTSPDGCRILYSTDGQDPTKYGEQYYDPITFDEEGEYTISAVCVNDKGIYSAIVTHKYEITISAPDIPVVSPIGGNYSIPTMITVTVPDHCTAYYTWDGSDPNVTSFIYTEPIAVPEGSNIFSVIIVDNRTDKMSSIYRSNYTYYE